jgi:hypothetical protein
MGRLSLDDFDARPPRRPRREMRDLAAPRVLSREYSPRALELAADIWRRRMVHEHQSSAVFSRLHPQLIEAEASFATKTAVLEAALDELHHAMLAGSIVALAGGEPSAELDLATEPLPEHADVPPKVAALRNVIFASCMSETVSVALLTEEREDTREPWIAAVVGELLKDEIQHAHLGWNHLAETWPKLDRAARAQVAEYIPAAAAHLERSMLAAMPLGAARSAELDGELTALGVLASTAARELYFETFRSIVVPQLRAHGLEIGY